MRIGNTKNIVNVDFGRRTSGFTNCIKAENTNRKNQILLRNIGKAPFPVFLWFWTFFYGFGLFYGFQILLVKRPNT